jgi:hypothetical protein
VFGLVILTERVVTDLGPVWIQAGFLVWFSKNWGGLFGDRFLEIGIQFFLVGNDPCCPAFIYN